jgi:hypothetical protein
MTEAVSGYGSVLSVAAEIPPAPPVGWTTKAELIEISDIDMSRVVIDVTPHSNDDIFSEQILGRSSPVTIDCTFNFTDANYPTFYADYITPGGVKKWYRIEFDILSKGIVFIALVSGLSTASMLDEQIKAKVSLAVTGPLTYETI